MKSMLVWWVISFFSCSWRITIWVLLISSKLVRNAIASTFWVVGMGKKGLKTSICRVWGFGECCNMSLWCRFRWRWNHSFRVLYLPSSFFFFIGSFLALSVIGYAFIRLMVTPFGRPNSGSFGCQCDGEGAWAIGVFYGKTPFSLLPIELVKRKRSFVLLF